MKSIHLENGGLLTQQVKNWRESIDPEVIEINSEVREYMRRDDLHFFGLLIDRELENVIVSSGFPSIMDFAAQKSFSKTRRERDEDEKFHQIEYFSWIFLNAMRFRERIGASFLTIHINYEGVDFVKDLVQDEDWGRDTHMNIRLMLRQQDNFCIKLYKEFELQRVLVDEDDLDIESKVVKTKGAKISAK